MDQELRRKSKIKYFRLQNIEQEEQIFKNEFKKNK